MDEQKIIGERYKLQHEIGMGGMGAVFLGVDTITQEQVAIKQLKPDVIRSDPGIVERFDREGEMLRKLHHPGIVAVLATVEEDDNHYIVLEYVTGGSLRDLLDETPRLPYEQVLQIALDLSDALARAHRLKIIHRDIKPANVLIAEDGTPRLTDFGVARMGDTTRVTATGAVVGTLAYLPPESLSGVEPDERSDIWAFGVMLYEMLAGRRPFDGDNTGALLTAILSQPVPDMLEFLDEDIPWSLMGLVYWMLEKEPEKRPASIRLVGAMIENIISGTDLPMNWFDESQPYSPGETPLPEDTARMMREFTTGTLRPEDYMTDTGRQQTPSPGQPVQTQVEDTQDEMKPPVHHGKLAAVSLAGLVLIGVIAGLLFFGNQATSPGTVTPAFDPAGITIEPADPGDEMVLVAQFEADDDVDRDAGNLIARQLRQSIEEDIPFSAIAIREYPAVITSDEEALAIAEKYGARVIIRGRDDGDIVEVEAQMGDLSNALDILSDDKMHEIADVRLEMTDPRRQTLAFAIVAVLNLYESNQGQPFNTARNLAILEQVDADAATPIGNSVSARYHRYFMNYIDNPGQALEEINDAVGLDAASPYLYAARSVINVRLGHLEQARDDGKSAMALGPSGWTTPLQIEVQDLFFIQHNPAEALALINTFVDDSTDDWWQFTMRGMFNYLEGNYDAASTDIETALVLDPQANFAHAFAIALALREGDLVSVQSYIEEVLHLFPDPAFSERLLSVIYSEDVADSQFIDFIKAFSNLPLRQWRSVIDLSGKSLDAGLIIPELHFMRGFAYCNLGDDAAAEAAYTAALELDPDFALLYPLRAEVRRNQGKTLEALQDITALSQTAVVDELMPYLPALTSGDLTCSNVFTVDLAALTASATESSD